MRGRIEIQSIEWPMSALPKVVSGGWLPVTLKNVAVWDGEGERVLRTEKVTGELDLHSLMFGRHDFVLRKVTMHGGEVVGLGDAVVVTGDSGDAKRGLNEGGLHLIKIGI